MMIGIVILALAIAYPVMAQDTTPPADTGCLICHENLYYLHDTGKWYCLCAVEMSCTCCHGGNPQALTEEQGHAGLVVIPEKNDAATCQKCHPEDYSERVEKFASVAGISTFHPSASPVAAAQLVEPLVEISPGRALSQRFLEPGRLVGLGLVFVALVVLGILGYRCWKADCMAKIR
jgi:hypothetical protein